MTLRLLKSTSAARRDLIAIASGAVLVLALSLWFDLFGTTITWMYRHDTWQLDELFTVAVFLAVTFALYSLRRWYELRAEILEREKTERNNRELIVNLERALAEVHTLRGLLPMCAWCKKIRDDSGYWMELEAYIQAQTDARVTHGICPDCARRSFSILSSLRKK
ncbi:MAG: hypothetical protein OEM41_09385 [Ignavibacteria bacterium]|nr:hypothetical protein [Ignavibacteria bacterium]